MPCSYLEVDLVSRGSDTRFRELGYGFKSDRESPAFSQSSCQQRVATLLSLPVPCHR